MFGSTGLFLPGVGDFRKTTMASEYDQFNKIINI